MNLSKKMKNAKKQLASFLLAMALVLAALSYPTPAYATGLTTILSGIDSGVKTVAEISKVYKDFNPPQEGYVTVINGLNETVTVRSYNNNDWAMFIAAGQINLKPGADARITASTDPVKLLWKRGDYGTMRGFGTKRISQSVAPKDAGHIFLINDKNTL
ncbi:hypothetical protein [Okeania sp. SIO2C2]|uniref:hypothetical protein n=1 Tax=Okeania sp. SIO2C2 TaxID=2607787 RepID=UPI0025796D9E|nr:hypothetical protein [Okeania sp. SIO2C2]